MLNSLDVDGMDGRIVADAKTVADCRTSWGKQLRVALTLAPPPQSSFLNYDYDWTGSAATAPAFLRDLKVQLVGAHGDSVLLQTCRHDDDGVAVDDYFVYRAGAAATRPPSLTQLPARVDITGLLQRQHADGEELGLTAPSRPRPRRPRAAEVEACVSPGGSRRRWGTERSANGTAAPVLLGNSDEVLMPWPHFVIGRLFPTVGLRFPCWSDYFPNSWRGIKLFCMAEAAADYPKGRDPPLAVAPPPRWFSCYHDAQVIRLVSITPRCCCDGPGAGLSSCARSPSAPADAFKFVVTTWTRTDGDDDGPMAAAWVQDASLDCEELWAFHGYVDLGLPRVLPQYPVVSPDNPDVVCFGVSDDTPSRSRAWMVEVDTRKKALRSLVTCMSFVEPHFPIKLQC